MTGLSWSARGALLLLELSGENFADLQLQMPCSSRQRECASCMLQAPTSSSPSAAAFLLASITRSQHHVFLNPPAPPPSFSLPLLLYTSSCFCLSAQVRLTPVTAPVHPYTGSGLGTCSHEVSAADAATLMKQTLMLLPRMMCCR